MNEAAVAKPADDHTGVPNPAFPDGTQLKIGRGRIHFISERDGGRPFNNCLICAALMGEEFQGYRIPAGYDDVVRQACGAPDYELDAHGQAVLDKSGAKIPLGTNLQEVHRGLTVLFVQPGTIVHLLEADLLASLKQLNGRGRGKCTYAIEVNTTNLPTEFQKLVGQDYDALHGWYVFAQETVNGVLMVAICDPMGQDVPGKGDDPLAFEPYTYQLIAWSDLKPAIHGLGDGTIDALQFVKNAARQAASA
jgi:hypothetical protein